MNYNIRLFFSFLGITFLFINNSFSQTTDSLSGKSVYHFHRFTPDYKYLLLSVANVNDGKTQKIFDVEKKVFLDWNDFPRDSYRGHSKYNLYSRYRNMKDGKSGPGMYLWRSLSAIQNTGKETSIAPIISVPENDFIRILADGSFFCKQKGKNGRGGKLYIVDKNGKKKFLSHKFPKKFKDNSTEWDITYDGTYGSFKRFYRKGSESFQAFEIQNMATGKTLDFVPIKNEKVIKIAFVTGNQIVYESWGNYKVTDWTGNLIYTLDLNRMSGGSPNRILNYFETNNRLYVIQQGNFKIGREIGVRTSIVSFDKRTGQQIDSKTFTNAIDIVPVRDNEFMVIYRDYNEHLKKNYDVNRHAGIGEGMAVEYIDESFNTVEFKYLQNSTRKASREKWQPPFPKWVSGIRKFQVVEHQGVYKMVAQKELFGFRLSDNFFVKNTNAKNSIKLANHIDPNQFLCDCINKYCHNGYVQNVVRPSKKFDLKFVQYETSSNGVTYKKTTTFKAENDEPYSYKTKCSDCQGNGFYICEKVISK